jgi:predicted SAM-dependent methyltransferase
MAATKPLSPSEFDAARAPRKLNLGCGNDLREGYVNVDFNAFNAPDLLADARKLDFLPACHYEEVLAQDVLEHLPRTHSAFTLAHWNRLLRMGGRLVLRVPSVLGIARLLESPQWSSPERQEDLIQCLFGTQAYTGDFHFTSFTPTLLRHYLTQAGFEVSRWEVVSGWLLDVEARKVVHIEKPPQRDFSELLQIADDEALLRACYVEILRREPDPDGYAFYLSGLRGGSLERRDLISMFVACPEYRAIISASPN